MTFAPHQIGDKGQRWEARYVVDGEEPRAIGWSDDRAGALGMAQAFLLRPTTTLAYVVDREAGREWIVHILSSGQPLCGFYAGKLPGDWPEQHRWVGLSEPAHLEEATCAKCAAQAESIEVIR